MLNVTDHIDSRAWKEYFDEKERVAYRFPWDTQYRLSNEERDCIASSIRQFELGENAEGRGFLAAAEGYAKASGDSEFPAALRFFIKEEQRHSRFLREFMISEGIPRLSKDWVDTSFRKLRRLAGLELYVIVLVTAEIIARPYYRGLRASTASPLLRAICTQILRDESQHLRFQAGTLQKLRKGQGLLRRIAYRCVHSALMFGTLFVVWSHHGTVLKKGGATFASFFRTCFHDLARLNTISEEQNVPCPVMTAVSRIARR